MQKKKSATRKRYTTRRYKKKGFKKFAQKVVNSTAEKKTVSTYSYSNNVDATGFQFNATNISQGDTDGTRDGDQLLIRSVEMELHPWLGATPDTNNIVRVMLVQWYGLASSLTVGDVLQVTSALNSSCVMSPYNHDNRYQFKVLYDRRFVLSANGTSTHFQKVMITRGFRRKVQYVAGSATSATNGVYMLAFSDSISGPHPALDYNVKINYSDL